MSRLGRATRLVASFLTGMAVALWLFPLLAGPAIQELRLERDAARGQVENLETEVRKLKEGLQKQQKSPVVRSVRMQVEGPDPRVVLEAERRLQKQLTEQYAGRPIDGISAFLLTRRLQGTILDIDGVRYQFDVELVVLGPELTIFGVLNPVKG
ncbi:MAG TPA: hypothetical protein VNT75_31995 [Symbiobacteriaceae bacterium]|nr:hypothetical protein [Symbiobacteriaceae bacterium]